MVSTQRFMAVGRIEVPGGMDGEEICKRAEALKGLCAAIAHFPEDLAAARAEEKKTVASSTGRLFECAHGCQWIKLEWRLEHPANGSGAADLESAKVVLEKAMEVFGASRALYGSSGVAERGMQEDLESRWWSDSAFEHLKAIAAKGRVGGAWSAKPMSKP